MNICKCEWCDKKVLCKGYCQQHYYQNLRWGEVRRSDKDENEIIVHDDYAEIIIYGTKGIEKARTTIDLGDIEKCKLHKWHMNTGYVSTNLDGSSLRLHRFLINTPEDLHTDHIDRDKMNNRKSNLRICTQSENNKNKGKYVNSKYSKRGIWERNERYYVYLKFNSKNNYIGAFGGIEDAINARKQAELKFHGFILED